MLPENGKTKLQYCLIICWWSQFRLLHIAVSQTLFTTPIYESIFTWVGRCWLIGKGHAIYQTQTQIELFFQLRTIIAAPMEMCSHLWMDSLAHRIWDCFSSKDILVHRAESYKFALSVPHSKLKIIPFDCRGTICRVVKTFRRICYWRIDVGMAYGWNGWAITYRFTFHWTRDSIQPCIIADHYIAVHRTEMVNGMGLELNIRERAPWKRLTWSAAFLSGIASRVTSSDVTCRAMSATDVAMLLAGMTWNMGNKT
jgi:hypothetical protein